jgi:hypothetical protein
MQSQRRHEKEKYEYDAQLDEEKQNYSAEFFFVDFEEVRRPRGSRVPEQSHRRKIKRGEYETDDKCAEEKVVQENDFFASRAAIILADASASAKSDGLIPGRAFKFPPRWNPC